MTNTNSKAAKIRHNSRTKRNFPVQKSLEKLSARTPYATGRIDVRDSDYMTVEAYALNEASERNSQMKVGKKSKRNGKKSPFQPDRSSVELSATPPPMKFPPIGRKGGEETQSSGYAEVNHSSEKKMSVAAGPFKPKRQSHQVKSQHFEAAAPSQKTPNFKQREEAGLKRSPDRIQPDGFNSKDFIKYEQNKERTTGGKSSEGNEYHIAPRST